MADRVALGKVGVLRFDISAQMAALGGSGADAHMREGTDLVVGADVAPIALAGIDRGPGVNDGILQQGVGADDAVRADDRLAAQDAARQDGRTGAMMTSGSMQTLSLIKFTPLSRWRSNVAA